MSSYIQYKNRPCGSTCRKPNRWTKDLLLKELNVKKIKYNPNNTIDELCLLLKNDDDNASTSENKPSTSENKPSTSENKPSNNTKQSNATINKLKTEEIYNDIINGPYYKGYISNTIDRFYKYITSIKIPENERLESLNNIQKSIKSIYPKDLMVIHTDKDTKLYFKTIDPMASFNSIHYNEYDWSIESKITMYNGIINVIDDIYLYLIILDDKFEGEIEDKLDSLKKHILNIRSIFEGMIHLYDFSIDMETLFGAKILSIMK
jgi:hypothetical protein